MKGKTPHSKVYHQIVCVMQRGHLLYWSSVLLETLRQFPLNSSLCFDGAIDCKGPKIREKIV